MLAEQRQIRVLLLRRLVGVTEEEVVTPRPDPFFEGAYELAVVPVADVGDQQPEQAGTLEPQPAGEGVSDVAELARGLFHPRALSFGDVGLTVQHPGDGLERHVRVCGDVDQSGGSWLRDGISVLRVAMSHLITHSGDYRWSIKRLSSVDFQEMSWRQRRAACRGGFASLADRPPSAPAPDRAFRPRGRRGPSTSLRRRRRTEPRPAHRPRSPGARVRARTPAADWPCPRARWRLHRRS